MDIVHDISIVGYGVDNGTKKVSWQTIYDYSSNNVSGTWNSFGSGGYSSGSFNYSSIPQSHVVGLIPIEYIDYKRIFVLDIFDLKWQNEGIFHGVATSNGESDSFGAVSKCVIKGMFKDFTGINTKMKSMYFTPEIECN
jgi:hypothetical protein